MYGKKVMKVSIITPCLNSAETIRQTIESVLYQTYKNVEYLIVDGGSTDGTLEIIKEYVPQFQGRLKYVCEPDHGIYDAMNKGIRMSHGNVIGIINSDDFYEENAVGNIVRHMGKGRYQVIYGYCRMFNNGHACGMLRRCHQNLPQAMIPHPTCFVTRNVYKEFGLFLDSFKVASDYELMLRLYVSNRVEFIQVKDIIANFRTGGISNHSKQLRRERALILYHYKMISFKDMVGQFWRE